MKRDKKDRIIVMSGSFDPMNLQDVKNISRARKQGDWIVVGVNSDHYITHHLKRKVMETYEIRRQKVEHLRCVDEVATFDDSDGTAIGLLTLVQLIYPDAEVFYIVEDEGTTTIPETRVRDVKFLNIK